MEKKEHEEKNKKEKSSVAEPEPPEAATFRVELEPEPTEPEHLFAWVAFGGGRHKCAGNAFALLQLKAIFATLLLDFDFSLVDAKDDYNDDHSGMTVKPKAPMKVRFKRKQK